MSRAGGARSPEGPAGRGAQGRAGRARRSPGGAGPRGQCPATLPCDAGLPWPGAWVRGELVVAARLIAWSYVGGSVGFRRGIFPSLPTPSLLDSRSPLGRLPLGAPLRLSLGRWHGRARAIVLVVVPCLCLAPLELAGAKAHAQTSGLVARGSGETRSPRSFRRTFRRTPLGVLGTPERGTVSLPQIGTVPGTFPERSATPESTCKSGVLQWGAFIDRSRNDLRWFLWKVPNVPGTVCDTQSRCKSEVFRIMTLLPSNSAWSSLPSPCRSSPALPTALRHRAPSRYRSHRHHE